MVVLIPVRVAMHHQHRPRETRRMRGERRAKLRKTVRPAQWTPLEVRVGVKQNRNRGELFPARESERIREPCALRRNYSVVILSA